MTTSYAWYVDSSTLLASDLNIELADDGLKMGLLNPGNSEIDYFSSASPINNEELKNHEVYNPQMVYQAVSASFQDQWFDPSKTVDELTPSFRSAFDLGSETTLTPLSNGGFAQFTLYFQSDISLYLYLDSETTSLTPSSSNSQIANVLNVNKQKLDQVKDCLRISFLSESPFNAEVPPNVAQPEGVSVDENKDKSQYLIYEPNATMGSSTLYGGRLNVKGDDPYFDYDNDENEIVYGEFNDASKIVRNASGAVANVSEEDLSSFVSNSKNPDKAFNLEESEANGFLIAKETSYTLAELSSDYESHPLLYLSGEDASPKKVVVSIWLEGWDLDMTDVINSAQFDLTLSFAGLAKPYEAK